MRVIITGADGALGRAVVTRFREAGCTVAALCGMLNEDQPADLEFAARDLADERNGAAVIGRVCNYLGGLDAVIHLVGGFHWLEVSRSRLEHWRQLFTINLETAIVVANAAAPRLGSGGSITFIGAASAQPAGAGMGPYAAAKSGVARLTEALAAELRERNIRVNAILPTIIDTPRNRLDMPDADFSRWTSPAAIADALHFLATPASRAITGALLPVGNAG